MTVSNVVNGKHQFVGERTRKAVEREIARLNYRVQHSAWSLRVARRRSVGMIVVDELPAFLSDHFTAHIVAGLTNILSHEDHTVSIQGIRGDRIDQAAIVRNFAVDGFCVIMSGTPEARRRIIDSLVRLDQPIVLIQEPIAPPDGDICIVRQDDAGGGRLIADHLAARRVRRLLVIVPGLEWPAVDERVAGLRQGIAAAGGDIVIDLVETAGEDFDSTQAAVAAYLDRNPLPGAIVGANDRLAIAAMALLESRGIAVPGRGPRHRLQRLRGAPLRAAADHDGQIAGLRDGRAGRRAPPRTLLLGQVPGARGRPSRPFRDRGDHLISAPWEGGRPRPPFREIPNATFAAREMAGEDAPPSQGRRFGRHSPSS